jgi:predicted dehydrogenase
VLADIFPRVFLLKAGDWTDAGRAEEWQPLPDNPAANAPASERSVTVANRRVVDDWLAAMREGREPVCSGRAAMKALEMVMGVFRAGLERRRVEFPLPERGHPLKRGA